MMKNEYRPVFSTMTPCSARYLVTIEAGIPVLANLPDTSSPGVMIVALIGSRMLKPGARLPKPCHFSFAFSTQSSRLPMPSAVSFSGPQTLNHQSLPHSSSTLRIARRKSSASAIDSSTSAVPPGASILAPETSHDAMVAYLRTRDVARGDDRVLRRRRCVHQVRLVEDVPVELACLRLLHDDLRGLRDAGE